MSFFGRPFFLSSVSIFRRSLPSSSFLVIIHLPSFLFVPWVSLPLCVPSPALCPPQPPTALRCCLQPRARPPSYPHIPLIPPQTSSSSSSSSFCLSHFHKSLLIISTVRSSFDLSLFLPPTCLRFFTTSSFSFLSALSATFARTSSPFQTRCWALFPTRVWWWWVGEGWIRK